MRVPTLLLPVLVTATAVAQAPPVEQYDARVTRADRQHWAFRPVQVPAVPAVRDAGWVQTPIDAFVLSRLEARGWRPAPAAEPRAILRRLYLQLTGLPPTIAEQERFLRDSSPDALDRVIDELLARPAYGERYARHWLDLARYADSNAYERDALKPSVWRYRDYAIRAFNRDKPFDRFVLEQIAGDELADPTAETVIATGFNRLGPWDDEPADPASDRYDQLDDMVSTTSRVFLGLTLACARCHDHKFEPLTMADYYRMVAVFNPLRRPQYFRSDLDDWAVVGAKRRALSVRDRANADLRLRDATARLLAGGSLDFASAEVERLRRRTPDVVRGYFFVEDSPVAPATHILLRGSATRPGAAVEPGVPVVLADKQPEFLGPDAYTTRRRLSLARWIASPTNPLTARVIVNRIW